MKMPSLCCQRRLAAFAILVTAGMLVAAPFTTHPRTIDFVNPISSAVQDDFNAAWARLGTFLAIVQGVEGFIPQSSILAVVADLNDALDYLEQANASLHLGQLPQASTSIAQANAVLDSVEPGLVALQAQASETRQSMLGWLIFVIAISCGGVVFILFLKRRHDQRKLRAFLETEIDYSKLDKT